MRLIDTDKLKKDILLQNILGEPIQKIIDRYIHIVDEQPTAFDVDNVVEQLEETKGIYSELSLIFKDNTEIKKYIGMEQAIALALEIVKGEVK